MAEEIDMENKTILVKMAMMGMRCSMCEAHVNDAIRKVDGVLKVKASASKGEARILVKEGTDLERIRDSVAKEGYGVGEITSEPYTKKGFFSRLFF